MDETSDSSCQFRSKMIAKWQPIWILRYAVIRRSNNIRENFHVSFRHSQSILLALAGGIRRLWFEIIHKVESYRTL